MVWTFKKWIVRSRSVPLAGLATAIATLLLATPAAAETIDASSLPPTTTAAAPAPAEQPQSSVGSTAPELEGATTEPMSTQDDTSVTPSPEPSLENSPDVPGPSGLTSAANAPAPATPSADAVPRPATIVDAVTTAGKKVSVPAEVELEPAVDRLAARVVPALQPADLLDSVAPAIAEGPPPSGPSPASGASRGSEARSFLPEMPRASFFLQAATPGRSAGGYLARTDSVETEGIPALSSSPSEETFSRAGVSGIAFASTSTRHLGSPAPADVPLPAPGSPATAVADSGGTSFVPIVALLALLALVAPAATRRLGKAPDFRAPSPFVCALERPG
jgi:hypothetical protein